MTYQTVIKKSSTELTYEGIPLTKDQFLCGMMSCGFDVSATRSIFDRLGDGGKWLLNLNRKEHKTILRVNGLSTDSGSSRGQGFWN